MTCAGQYKDAVRMTVDQMDVIKKFVERYPDTFTFVTTAQGLLLVLLVRYFLPQKYCDVTTNFDAI